MSQLASLMPRFVILLSSSNAALNVVDASGWSAGTWFSTVGDRVVAGGSLEWDLYGGYSAALGPFGYSLMAHYYTYPGAALSGSGTRHDYGEVSAGVPERAGRIGYSNPGKNTFVLSLTRVF